MKNKYIGIAAFLGCTAVIFGAFGAHYLKEKLEPSSLESFKTAVFYQFIHTVVILVLTAIDVNNKWLQRAINFFIVGILFFSGSIYCLATQSIHAFNVKFLGPLTPIGGLLFILGWGHLFVYSMRHKNNQE